MDLRKEIKKMEAYISNDNINETENKETEYLRKKFVNWANGGIVDASTEEEILDALQYCLDKNSFEDSVLKNELALCQKAYINNLRHHKTNVSEFKYACFPVGLELVIRKFTVEALVEKINAFLKDKNIESITYDCTCDDIEKIITDAVGQIIDNDSITYYSYIADSSFPEDVYMLMKILKPRRLRSDCIKNGLNFAIVYLRYMLKFRAYIESRELICLSKKMGIKSFDADRIGGKYGFSDFSVLEYRNWFRRNSAICLSYNKTEAKEKFNKKNKLTGFLGIKKHIY